MSAAKHLDSWYPTISYVDIRYRMSTYDIVAIVVKTYDIMTYRMYMSYTISYAYDIVVQTYDIVCQTYDIVECRITISYTVSYTVSSHTISYAIS